MNLRSPRRQSYEFKFELEEGQRGAYKITRDDDIIVADTVSKSN